VKSFQAFQRQPPSGLAHADGLLKIEATSRSTWLLYLDGGRSWEIVGRVLAGETVLFAAEVFRSKQKAQIEFCGIEEQMAQVRIVLGFSKSSFF
jgi:hypothetical protein